MLFITEKRDGSKVINLTRGDDAVIEVPLENIDKEAYILSDNEYLIFSLRMLLHTVIFMLT